MLEVFLRKEDSKKEQAATDCCHVVSSEHTLSSYELLISTCACCASQLQVISWIPGYCMASKLSTSRLDLLQISPKTYDERRQTRCLAVAAISDTREMQDAAISNHRVTCSAGHAFAASCLLKPTYR